MRVSSRSRWAHVTLAIAVTAIVAACSGSNPGGPSGSSSSGSGSTSGTCRTYPTAADVSVRQGATTQNARLTASFNTSNNTMTITTLTAAGVTCTTSVDTYQSRADFVDEIRVIPGVTLTTMRSTTNSAGCGGVNSSVTYAYDGQRRLTSFSTLVLGVTSTTSYTAWDSSGRPTVGSFPGATINNSYNDAARTLTQSQTSGGSTSTTTVTYDANGNQVTSVVTSGNVTSTTTFTNTATAQVCK